MHGGGELPNGVKVVQYEENALVAGELWLCIVQAQRSVAEAATGAGNAAAVAIVRQLLTPAEDGFAPIDRDCDSESLLRVIVLPELAFGLPDWDEVNVIVNAYPRRVIVSCGFGYAKAGDLRQRTSFVPASTSDTRNVNFGCVWIKAKADAVSACEYFCKNFPEQSKEVPQFSPLQSDEVLAINFPDLVVAPLICSDLLEDTQGSRVNALDRLGQHMAGSESVPLLVLASLLQAEPWHGIWASKMSRAVDAITCVLALSNVAQNVRPKRREDDDARNLSGVYTAVSHHKESPAWSAWSSCRHEATLTGQPIRDSLAIAVGGVLRLGNYSPTSGRHLWLPRWGKTLAGPVLTDASHALNFELPRILERARHFEPSNAEPVTQVRLHLADGTSPQRGLALLETMLAGPFPTVPTTDPQWAWTQRTNLAAEHAVCFVDALKRGEASKWPVEDKVSVSLDIDLGQRIVCLPTYVWISGSRTAQQMTSALINYARASAPLPAIAVVAANPDGLDVDKDQVRKLYDVTAPKDDVTVDAATPRATTNVVAIVDRADVLRLSSNVSIVEQYTTNYAKILGAVRNQLLRED